MATKHPRLNVVLESSIYTSIQKLADKEGVSLSLVARDLIKQALELHEDIYWDTVAEKRTRSFSRKTAIAHTNAWKK